MARKRYLMMVVALLVVCSLTLIGQGVGLRTLTPDPPPESAPETEAQTGPRGLRTIDPLLRAFQEHEPQELRAGWRKEALGKYSLFLPDDFRISSVMSGRDLEATLYDDDYFPFTEIFIFMLEEYTTDELVDDLIAWLYPDETEGVKEYEAWIHLDESRTAYTTKLVMKDHSQGLPLYFLYHRGDSEEIVLSGETVIMIFQIDPYDTPERLQLANETIIGISGSLISSWSAREIVPTRIDTSTRDPFIMAVYKALEEEGFEDPGADWQEHSHLQLGFSLPPVIEPHFFDTDTGLVGADFAYEGIVVGKVIVGETQELHPIEGEVEEIIDLFLSGLGQHQWIDHESWELPEESLNIWRIDFQDYACWLAFYSESPDPSYFGQGTFFIFFGIAPRQPESEIPQWSRMFSTILGSLVF